MLFKVFFLGMTIALASDGHYSGPGLVASADDAGPYALRKKKILLKFNCAEGAGRWRER